MTGDGGQEAWDSRRGKEEFDRRCETGDRRCEPGDSRQEDI